MEDPSQIEFVAQAHDTVFTEELSLGRLRILSLRDGKAITRNPRWFDGIKSWCCTKLDSWLDQREVRRDLRRRRSRDAKLREEMEHRRYGPAFVCRLPSKLLR